MGDSSRRLMRLRPVTFFYKSTYAVGPRLRQYGLIAEEVAKVYPELVQFGDDGRPNTVLYHMLPAMLLNEYQRQQRELGAVEASLADVAKLRAAVQEKDRTIAVQQQQLQAMQGQVESVQRRDAALEQQLRSVMLRLSALERSAPAAKSRRTALGGAKSRLNKRHSLIGTSCWLAASAGWPSSPPRSPVCLRRRRSGTPAHRSGGAPARER